ncbi:hypothetical protein EYF80_062336 [Liparis tanakae]|uniref:Uncharacterized protein n=1 Tax=Liparis tanakae TaxID=230148 RepID=A0A4Z2EG60_9TELE|nr:hypothetical protein EYF80_062336 [Liparis tanakae]
MVHVEPTAEAEEVLSKELQEHLGGDACNTETERSFRDAARYSIRARPPRPCGCITRPRGRVGKL